MNVQLETGIKIYLFFSISRVLQDQEDNFPLTEPVLFLEKMSKGELP